MYSDDIISPLLQHGANPNLTDVSGNTPLHWAAQVGEIDGVQTLLKHHANINVQDKQGRTALMLCVEYANKGDMIRELLKQGANTHLKDLRGVTALGYARSEDYPEMVRLWKAARATK